MRLFEVKREVSLIRDKSYSDRTFMDIQPCGRSTYNSQE
jgi:hypothetical protein